MKIIKKIFEKPLLLTLCLFLFFVSGNVIGQRKPVNVTYNLNGGKLPGKAPTTHRYGMRFVLPDAEKPGYYFRGWGREIGGMTVSDVATFLNIMIEQGVESVELVAIFNRVITYDIKFHPNDGTTSKSSPQRSTRFDKTYNVETKTFSLPEFTRVGYDFEGWYENKNFTGKPTTQINQGSIGDRTYFAKWTYNLESRSVKDVNQFVKVPTGTFMPSKDSTQTISSFEIGVYEVVYGLWFMVNEWAKNNSYYFVNQGTDGSSSVSGTIPTGRNMPVTNISWNDAIVWCNAFSVMSGLEPCYTMNGRVLRRSNDIKNAIDVECNWEANGYRLPTQLEWHYAASYIDKNNRLPNYLISGVSITGNIKNDDVAWYGRNSYNPKIVGEKRPNPLGIYDMSGNVAEFCWGCNLNVYPYFAIDYRGSFIENKCVAKGGSFNDSDNKDSKLEIGSYSLLNLDEKSKHTGFRLARSIEKEEYFAASE